jgi:hypothetical protein
MGIFRNPPAFMGEGVGFLDIHPGDAFPDSRRVRHRTPARSR